jgi:transcriptional repressor NrdR
MKCPFCQQEDTKVVDSRSCREKIAIRRRRLCQKCHQRFSTIERIGAPTFVVKRDGARVPFDRAKIAASIRSACTKETLGARALDEMVSRVEAELSRIRTGEVGTPKIGELVLLELRRLDTLAYVRFATVHHKFKNVSELQAALEPILQPVGD